MENYTVDLAQMGRKVGGAPMIGPKPAKENGAKRNDDAAPPEKNMWVAEDEDDDDDFLDDYTIDLEALGEKPSSVVVEDRELQRDVLDSEDDGPADFTLNLEKWMRGTEEWKKENGGIGVDDSPAPEGDQEQNGAQAGVHDGLEESAFEPVAASTPGPLTRHAIIEEGVQGEARLQAPPLSRMNTEMMQDQAAEEVFDRIAALQAEIERMRVEEEERRLAHQVLEQEHEKLKRDYEVEGEDAQSKHAALQQDYEQSKQSYQQTNETLQQENDQLRENYDDAIGQLQVLAQDSPTNHDAKDAQLSLDSEPTKQELSTVKAKAEADEMAADARINALQAELQTTRDDLFALRATVESIQEAHNIRIEELNAEIEVRTNEVALERKESVHRANEAASLTETISQKDNYIYKLSNEIKVLRTELEHAQGQLVETRRIVETVEEENDRFTQQNDRQAEDIASLKAKIESNVDKTTESVDETQTSSSDEEPDTVDKATHDAALQALSQQHQATLASLGTTHGKEVSILRSALLKASQAMQKRETKLTETHQEEVAPLKAEIAELEEKLAKPAPSSPGLENELRSAIRVLSNKLEKANASLATARADAADARQKAEDAKETNAIINAELEARFVETMEAREKEWRRRIALLFKERDRMSRALLWGWGREEMGPKEAKEREQAYRYKYVTR
jgi:chromosome segregation ATPase